jgi:hypothetical protein
LSAGLAELPGRLRLASVLTVLLSGLCGLWAAWQGFSLFRFAELKQAPVPVEYPLDPALAEQFRVSELLALEQMREPRLVVLFALALACSLGFVASTRLLRPAGLPREGVRKILVWALVVAAALRTIDGAQAAVIYRSVAGVMQRAFKVPASVTGAAAEQMRGLVIPTWVGVPIFQTALVVGAFLLLSQYFRSARVKEWVAHADGQVS